MIEYFDGGEIEHLIEEYSNTDETTTGGSVDIQNLLTFYREKTSGDIEKTRKKILHTPIGNFAVYYMILQEDDSLTDLTGVDTQFRKSVGDEGYVKMRGKIRRSPFGELLATDELFSKLGASGFQKDTPGYQQMKAAAEYFEMPMQNLDGAFMFTLIDEFFQDVEPDFPDEYREYTVLGEIRHVYGEGERRHHLDLLELNVEKGMSRQERNQYRRNRKSLENAVKEAGGLVGRSFSSDDFHVSFPDIEIDPIAIYR